MSDTLIARLRRIAGIVLAAAAVLCAAGMTVACVLICRSGDRPFTPESIGAAWKITAIFFCFTLALTVGTGMLHLLYPAPVQTQKGIVFPEIRLAKIKARLARKQYTDDLLLPLRKQEIFVKSLRITSLAVCMLCAAYPLYYLNNLDHFTEVGEQLNTQVLAAVVPALCCTAVALGYCCAAKILSDVSCEKAILYAKSIMLLPAPAAEKKPRGKQEKGLPDYTIFVLRSILLVTAVCLIVAGILNGSVNDVLQKAIKICTECIGLG